MKIPLNSNISYLTKFMQGGRRRRPRRRTPKLYSQRRLDCGVSGSLVQFQFISLSAVLMILCCLDIILMSQRVSLLISATLRNIQALCAACVLAMMATIFPLDVTGVHKYLMLRLAPRSSKSLAFFFSSFFFSPLP